MLYSQNNCIARSGNAGKWGVASKVLDNLSNCVHHGWNHMV